MDEREVVGGSVKTMRIGGLLYQEAPPGPAHPIAGVCINCAFYLSHECGEAMEKSVSDFGGDCYQHDVIYKRAD